MTARASLRPIRALLNLCRIPVTSDFTIFSAKKKKPWVLFPWPQILTAMGTRPGLPMAPGILISRHLTEADRPDFKSVIKAKAKKLTVPPCPHREMNLLSLSSYNPFRLSCQPIFSPRLDTLGGETIIPGFGFISSSSRIGRRVWAFVRYCPLSCIGDTIRRVRDGCSDGAGVSTSCSYGPVETRLIVISALFLACQLLWQRLDRSP